MPQETISAKEYQQRYGVRLEDTPEYRRRAQPERDLQMACTQWRDIQIASGRLRDKTLLHIPSERKDKLDAIQMKRCGAVAGVPDWLCLFLERIVKHVPGEHRYRLACCAFIELKAPKGSLSKEQREFRDLCQDLGIPYSIARSLEEFQQIVSDYGMLKEGKR